MRKKLDRAKAPAGTEDCVQVRAAEESFKVASPFLIVTRQVPFSIINPGSQLDFESLGAYSLNPGRKPFIIDAAGGCHDADPSTASLTAQVYKQPPDFSTSGRHQGKNR